MPSGKCIHTSMLVDIWGIGDRIDKKRVLFALGLLAGWFFVKWRVIEEDDKPDLLDPFDNDCPLQWRLAGRFYELAQTNN